MGMTKRVRRRVGRGTLVAVLLFPGCGEEPAPADEGPTAESPLVIESPMVRVVSGPDTFRVYAPTVFPFIDLGRGDAEPPMGALELARAAMEALQTATPALDAMGVRVTHLGEVPVVLDLAPGVDEGAGPPPVAGGMGYLLVHPRGGVRRLDRATTTTGLVCAAAGLFGIDPPPDFARSCGPGL